MAFLRNKSCIELIEEAVAVADEAIWCAALGIVVLILVSSMKDVCPAAEAVPGTRLAMLRPCEEIYVVGEGETLQMISDKCGDPFIVERNPHVRDPDDVLPGLVIMLDPFNSRAH